MTDRPAPPADVVTVLPAGSHRLRDPAAHPVPVDHLRRAVGAGGRARRAGPRGPGSRTAGFFYVAVCDHTSIPDRLAGAMSTTWYDTIATLGWLAG